MQLEDDQDARRKLLMQWELATMQSNFHGMVDHLIPFLQPPRVVFG